MYNGKRHGYIYAIGEYQSAWQKLKDHFRHENKVNKS